MTNQWISGIQGNPLFLQVSEETCRNRAPGKHIQDPVRPQQRPVEASTEARGGLYEASVEASSGLFEASTRPHGVLDPWPIPGLRPVAKGHGPLDLSYPLMLRSPTALEGRGGLP